MQHRDFLYLGPTPHEEECAQVRDPRYGKCANLECQVFIAALIAAVGPPPGHRTDENAPAQFRVKSNPHDFGTYFEVVIKFNSQDEAAVAYAQRVEDRLARWDDAGFAGPLVFNEGRIAGVAFPNVESAIRFAEQTLRRRASDERLPAAMQLLNLQAAYPQFFADGATT